MHPAGGRGLPDQCASARVPFLFKQWGEWAPGNIRDYCTTSDRCQVVDPIVGLMGRPWLGWGVDRAGRTIMLNVGKKASGRLLDGVEHNGYPVGK